MVYSSPRCLPQTKKDNLVFVCTSSFQGTSLNSYKHLVRCTPQIPTGTSNSDGGHRRNVPPSKDTWGCDLSQIPVVAWWGQQSIAGRVPNDGATFWGILISKLCQFCTEITCWWKWRKIWHWNPQHHSSQFLRRRMSQIFPQRRTSDLSDTGAEIKRYDYRNFPWGRMLAKRSRLPDGPWNRPAYASPGTTRTFRQWPRDQENSCDLRFNCSAEMSFDLF